MYCISLINMVNLWLVLGRYTHWFLQQKKYTVGRLKVCLRQSPRRLETEESAILIQWHETKTHDSLGLSGLDIELHSTRQTGQATGRIFTKSILTLLLRRFSDSSSGGFKTSVPYVFLVVELNLFSPFLSIWKNNASNSSFLKWLGCHGFQEQKLH